MNSGDKAGIISNINKLLPKEYQVEGFIKQGGQGSVFKGTYNGRVVAIKILFDFDEERLKRELKCLSGIVCPSLVKVIHCGLVVYKSNSLPVIAYEFLANGDLRCLGGRQLTSATIAKIGFDVSLALETLWENRIVHRDVKPDNVLIGNNGGYVLADVGVARHLDCSTLTPSGACVGTPGYMSPEQYHGRKALTTRSDIFSLGVTLYEMAAQVHPFGYKQADIGRITPAPLANHRKDLPPRLTSLIDCMMNVSVVSRPINTSLMFKDLMGAN